MIIDLIKKKYHYGRYKVVKGLLPRNTKNLLDIGCGSPSSCMHDASFLKFIGYGQGMDIEPRDIPFPFTEGNIMDIPFKDRTFDVVTALEVIEHIDDPIKALQEMHRVLKDDGICIISTPDNHLFFRIFWFFWERTFGQMWHETHETIYTKKQWLELIKKTGLFKIISVKGHWGIIFTVKLKKLG